MFLSWKLWRTLHRPPSNYFLDRFPMQNEPLALYHILREKINPRLWTAMVALICVLIVVRLGITNVLLAFFILPGIVVFAFLAMPFLLPVITALAGGYWAANISSSVLREQQGRTYDLLCLGPNGTLGANWSIANSELHKGWIYGSLYYGSLASLIFGGSALGLMVVIFLYMTFTGASMLEIVSAARTVLDLAVILFGFWAHYLQSVVIGVLIGLYLPTHMGRESPWVAFGVNGLIQVGTYGLVILAIHLLSPFMSGVGPDSGLAFVVIPLLALVALLGLRELVIRWLWGAVSHRLNADESERKVLIQSLIW